MIDGLVSGKLCVAPVEKTGQSGKTFVTAKVRARHGDGESLFVNAIAFSDSAKAALVALGDGDAVSLAGKLTPKIWTDRNGDAKPALDMVVDAVLTVYHVRRKREAVQTAAAARGMPGSSRQPMSGTEQARQAYGGAADDDMNDDF